MKNLIIVAGVNGAGKTTFAKPYVKEKGYTFLNADEIAKDLENKGIENAMIAAGRIFFQQLNDYLEMDKDFVVETTLSGAYINKVAKKAKAKGYTISMIYVFIDDVEMSIQRVKNRVLKGGHDVPIEDIRRRFDRSRNNFWKNFTELANSWTLLYNGIDGFQQVAISKNESFIVENKLLFNLFHQKER